MALLPAGARAGPDYQRAELMFNAAPLEAQLRFEALLTAAGYITQPSDTFTPSLFQAVQRFQTANGLSPDGIIRPGYLPRLMTEAQPMIGAWGFVSVTHPSVGKQIWVPRNLLPAAEPIQSGILY